MAERQIHRYLFFEGRFSKVLLAWRTTCSLSQVPPEATPRSEVPMLESFLEMVSVTPVTADCHDLPFPSWRQSEKDG